MLSINFEGDFPTAIIQIIRIFTQLVNALISINSAHRNKGDLNGGQKILGMLGNIYFSDSYALDRARIQALGFRKT